jgi:hypothetical protein
LRGLEPPWRRELGGLDCFRAGLFKPKAKGDMRECMASPKTEAAVSRPQGIQEDMEQLLAGAAIKGAQAVAKVRLGMILLLIAIPRAAVFLSEGVEPRQSSKAAQH